MRETAEFRRGRDGERQIEAWLQARGWHVIPSYDYCGDGEKAPRLTGRDTAYPVPDLDVAKDGQRYWTEVKVKACATFYRTLARLEHGIELHLYRAYQEVERLTGTSVWIVIVEDDTREILAASLAQLVARERIYDGPKMGRRGMVFWPRAAFRLIGRLDA